MGPPCVAPAAVLHVLVSPDEPDLFDDVQPRVLALAERLPDPARRWSFERDPEEVPSQCLLDIEERIELEVSATRGRGGPGRALRSAGRPVVFVVDTNLLIYAADRDSPFHEVSRGLLEEWRWRPSAWFVTWGILYEFLRVTTHRRVMRNPWSITESAVFVEAVLAETVAELPRLSGNIVHDTTTAVLMREHGVRRILTRDMEFHRFPFWR